MKRGELLTPIQAMELAIAQGYNGSGFVSPNPQVGCVVVDQNHRFLASGYHAQIGGSHAEVEALNQISNPSDLEGATVYVTLEPCAHHGRTPPCATKLASLPIRKVVVGLIDPNPKVAGRGAEILRSAKIEVEMFQGLEAELTELAEVFLHNMATDRAFLTLKSATTLDGMVGLKSGESQWITGSEARGQAHAVRGAHDAVMVGRGTVTADNPSLNSRLERFAHKTNYVIVLDPNAALQGSWPNLNLVKCRPLDKIIWVVDDKLAGGLKSDIPIWGAPLDAKKGFDLVTLTRNLRKFGIHSVLVEGGPALLSRCLEQRVAQRWLQYIAPTLLGAASGLSVAATVDIKSLREKIDLRAVRCEKLGRDFLVTGRLD